MSREQAEQAIERARIELCTYYHPDCETDTEINDEVIVLAALDPWYFPLHGTDCDGCGEAAMRDVVLKDKRTLHEAFSAMRKSVPVSGKLMRFLGIPLIFGAIGACVSPFVPTKNPENADLVSLVLGLGLIGFILGCFAIRYVFKELRRAGFFW